MSSNENFKNVNRITNCMKYMFDYDKIYIFYSNKMVKCTFKEAREKFGFEKVAFVKCDGKKLDIYILTNSLK